MEQNPTPAQFLHELERRGEVPDEAGRLRVFQEACCQSLAEFLPLESEQWLQIARAYRLGEATASELEEVRVAAWEHLGSTSLDVSNPKVAAVRALICLLHPDERENYEYEAWRNERFESLDYFLTFSNSVVDRREIQARLLRDLFPELGASD